MYHLMTKEEYDKLKADYERKFIEFFCNKGHSVDADYELSQLKEEIEKNYREDFSE